MWKLLEFGVAGALLLILLLWTLLPLAQHAVDRTVGFWVFYGLIELALIGFIFAVYRKKN